MTNPVISFILEKVFRILNLTRKEVIRMTILAIITLVVAAAVLHAGIGLAPYESGQVVATIVGAAALAIFWAAAHIVGKAKG
ncbi:MAG: hypothetical protein HZA37_01865 [Parcubacteria group bacterium]|nr:hypothetical protein [Parcubacteria group bacterium]